MASRAETDAMRRALALAAAVDLARDPNPRVGAVVLSPTGEVVAEAAHGGAGTAHAEAAALAHAGARCSGRDRGRDPRAVRPRRPDRAVHRGHPGRRGSTRGLRPARPQPRGRRRAGVTARGRCRGRGRRARRASPRALNPHWTFAMTRQRPFVTWKFAATLDGRSAAADGTSRWVSGAAARADVHRLRAGCDTVLVGTGTVAIDNPRLTVRTSTDQPLPREAQPRRAVMGLRDLDPRSHVLDDVADTVLLRTRDPNEALCSLFDDGQPARLARGWTHPGGCVHAGRPRRRGRRLRRADAAGRRAVRRSPTWASRPSATLCGSSSTT